jgi:hypothetical protein
MPTGKSPFAPKPLPPDMRKGKGSFVRAAGSFVPKIAAKVFEKYGFHSAEIMTEWPRVAGPEFASFTQPEKIRWPRLQGANADSSAPEAQRPGATLVLRVEPARALDAEYRSAEIIDRINRYFGYRAVETLKLIQAPLNRPNTAAAVGASPPNQIPPPPGTAQVLDPALKSALEVLWANVAAATRKR